MNGVDIEELTGPIQNSGFWLVSFMPGQEDQFLMRTAMESRLKAKLDLWISQHALYV